MLEVYLDKLNELLEIEGYPQTLTFENSDGDIVRYHMEIGDDVEYYG